MIPLHQKAEQAHRNLTAERKSNALLFYVADSDKERDLCYAKGEAIASAVIIMRNFWRKAQQEYMKEHGVSV